MNTKPVEFRFDRHFWARLALGLPVVAAAILGLASLGWWFQGAPAALGPAQWLVDPLMILGLGTIGGILGFFAVGSAMVVGWPAFIVGSYILSGAKTKRLRQ